MSTRMLDAPSDSNPFSTRHTRPGALPYLFPRETSASDLLRALEHHDWWGAIVGPHGSGKSTLLAAFMPLLEAVHRTVVLYVLHAGERRWSGQHPERWNTSTQVIVDGYEQLSRWSQWRLRRACQRAGAGLLVTSHQPVDGLATLYTTHSDLQLARSLARRLLGAASMPITDAEVDACYDRAGGNLRETWFQLFDLYEQRRSSKHPST